MLDLRPILLFTPLRTAYTIMAPVGIWESPRKYLVWAARQKPAIFWSMIVGGLGPVYLLVAPPVRHFFGDGPRPVIPLTYPIPKGPRTKPTGYED